MPKQILGAQRDFSFGEIDVTLKRADEHPARKAGLRQMANMRILNSGAIQDRPGRSALFPASVSSRIEELTLTPGHVFKLAFGAANGTGQLQVYSSTGAQVASFTNQGGGSPLPWTLLNVASIVYAQLGLSIYITFPGMKPQVLTWNGVSTWALTDYAELLNGSQKRTPFYRISPQGITILPSAPTGAITVTASAPVFTPAHVGTRIRFVNRQILITSYTDSTHVGATVQETLPGSQVVGFATDPSDTFSVGDVIIGSTSGAKAIVVVVDGPGRFLNVQLLNSNTTQVSTIAGFRGGETITVAFVVGETVAGPGGSRTSSGTLAIGSPLAVSVWDDEVINAMRGYPASCFVDQFRLGFCNFPSVPNGICWSAINSPTDLYVGANPTDAMFELTPDKVQVYYVIPGAESSEFIFTDRKLYYIKIDAANPLKPGSVGFQTLSGDGCAQVQPRPSQEIILYVNAGRTNVMAIIAPGAFYRPFNTKNLTEFHNHLFENIQAIAVPTADGTFDERYAYVLNGDGTLVVGKYTLQDGQIVPTIGWGPWSGSGTISWVAAWDASVYFTTNYFGVQTICEVVDVNQYLDAALSVNAMPSGFAPPAGKGPLWWIPARSVSLIDQSTRSMGTYQIDGNGFIIPQSVGGEDLTRLDLVAGQPWTSTVEPFCPNTQPGTDVGKQRMKRRQVAEFAAYVIHSSGFMLGYLYSGIHTRDSPPLGTLMNFRRFPAWNMDDDTTLPPPERETAETYAPLGSTFDPRVVLIKDTPGPLQLLEISIEVSI